MLEGIIIINTSIIIVNTMVLLLLTNSIVKEVKRDALRRD
jgi:hypothetical protein